MTRMYGPAVRCKRNRRGWRNLVSRQCIRPLGGAHMAPGHHGGKRACDLIRRQASIGLLGSPVLAYAGKTVAPFLPFSLADLGGKWVRYMLSLSISFVRPRRRLSPAPTAGRRGRRAQILSRLAALAATVRLGLDGIEHDGTLARSGPSSGRLGRCF